MLEARGQRVKQWLRLTRHKWATAFFHSALEHMLILRVSYFRQWVSRPERTNQVAAFMEFMELLF